MSIDPSDPNLSADLGEILPVIPACLRAAAMPPPSVRRRSGARDEAVGMTLESRRRIGRDLRLLYAEILNLPLPDRFDALLADLAARTETRGSS